MTAKRRKIIVYTVFALAVIWGVYNFMPGEKTSGVDNNPNYSPADSVGMRAVQTAGVNFNADVFSEWGRDPFVRRARTVRTNVSPGPFFKLTAVSGSGNDYLAIINGHVLGVGEEIEGWKVVSISDREALLSKNTEKISLKIRN